MPARQGFFSHTIRLDFIDAYRVQVKKWTLCRKSAAAPVRWTKLAA
jgi:hypothetical protein